MKSPLKTISAKKLQLDQLRPLAPELEQALDEWLRVELTYTSNAIEGNTLTRMETAEVLEKGIAATVSKSLKDQLEALNHAKALDFVQQLAKQRQTYPSIQERDLLAIHKFILSGIDEQWAGRYRQSEVFVKGTTFAFPKPHSVPYAMAEFIQWLERDQNQHPLRLAADAHFKLVSIHPFVDGNGRTARLLMNLILHLHGYPMAVIRSEERTRYLDAVSRGQMKGDLQPFYALIDQAAERSLDAWLAAASGKHALTPFVQPVAGQRQKLLKIGEVAEATDETTATIRYWTKEGLLRVSGQSAGGYHLYVPETVERVKQVRSLQQSQRLTLREIKHALDQAA